jgi:hypothetical protein
LDLETDLAGLVILETWSLYVRRPAQLVAGWLHRKVVNLTLNIAARMDCGRIGAVGSTDSVDFTKVANSVTPGLATE